MFYEIPFVNRPLCGDAAHSPFLKGDDSQSFNRIGVKFTFGEKCVHTVALKGEQQYFRIKYHSKRGIFTKDPVQGCLHLFMHFLLYNKHSKQFSRQLRRESTLAEVLLWNQLKSRSMSGYPFNRQKPLKNYIVDFYCKPLNLVIELDGQYHNDESIKVRDEKRQKILELMNLNFLRFTEEQVRCDLEKVVRAIQRYIMDYEKKFPSVIQKVSRNKKQ